MRKYLLAKKKTGIFEKRTDIFVKHYKDLSHLPCSGENVIISRQKGSEILKKRLDFRVKYRLNWSI
jgi:hypothetical protein